MRVLAGTHPRRMDTWGEFLRTAHRLEAARCTAGPIVRELRSRLPLVDVPRAVPEPWRTPAMVEELCTVAIDRLRSSPHGSVTLARLATTVAAAIDDSWPRVLRAQATARAWCTLGDAWRAAGDPHAALHALEQARAALAPEPALAEERATVDLTEGRTVLQLGARDQARPFLLAARTVLHAHGLTRLAAEANTALTGGEASG